MRPYTVPEMVAIPMPNFLTVDGVGSVQVQVGTLTDAQALEVWQQQQKHWLAHVRKRRAQQPSREKPSGIAKRWSR